MKKLLLALLVLGLLVTGGLAFQASQQVEEAYHRTVHAFAQHPDVRLLESSYTRGWRGSSATTSFELLGRTGTWVGDRLRAAGVEGARHRVGFRLEHRIAHGPDVLLEWLRAGRQGTPVLARVQTTATFDRESETDLRHAFGEPPALQVRAVVRSSGVGEASLQMPGRALQARPPEPGRVWQGAFHGLQGEAVFTTDGLSLAGSIESGGFEGGAGPERFEARGLQMSFDLHRPDATAAWSGHLDVGVSSLRLSEDGPRIEGLQLAEERGVGPQGATRAVQVAVAGLETSEGRTLGPGRLDLVIRGDAADALPPASAPGEDDATAEGAPAPDGALAARAIAALPALAAAGAGLELRTLELATPEGPLQARGHVRPAVVPPRLVATPLGLLAGIDLRLELRAPEALLTGWGGAALRDGVDGLRERGLVRVDQGVVETRLELREGVLRAHGEVVPLEPLLGVPIAGLPAASAPRP